MRILTILLLVGILSACAGKTVQQAPTVQPEPQPISVPYSINYSSSPVADYLQPLIYNLSFEPYYDLVNPRRITNSYVFDGQVDDTDPSKLVFAYRSKFDDSWAYVTSGIGRSPVANIISFSHPNFGNGYALVLQQVKVCLVTQASAPPLWRGGKWIFPVQPGYFECTGLTNRSIFKIGYGLPGALGPYFGDKDTILVFKNLGQLQQILVSLKAQFPMLRIPNV
ncbi:hypothetical protein ACMXYW_15145 [Neptuniibacter sp. QD48_55]|uniref:hypothetical protein n=1 Tax=Neptuniibacter sp. QD48_55 TaxID=3398212 RepID=UPI0039F6056E